MSNSKELYCGQRIGKAPEKSSFVQTCNLLSQYIKEKGSLRDLNLEIGGRVESLEAIVKSGLHHSAPSAPAAIESPKDQPDSSINTPQDSSHKPPSKTSSDSKAAASQLTIFYSGRVLVFDDFPTDKAKELVAFAKRRSAQMSYGILSNTNTLQEKPSPSPREGLPPRPQAATAPVKPVGISSNTCKEKMDSASCGDAPPVPPRAEAAGGSDLPIARRSSIHRFLEKRKDRAAARGPYQVQEQPAIASSSKSDEHLELKL